MGDKIAVMHGDRTGEELLVESLRVLAASGANVELVDFDLSLTERERTANGVVREAAAAVAEFGYGLKAATDTVGEIGSPNAILREEMNASVIVRSGRPLPGVQPYAGINHPITIVRMAVGDAYGAKEGRTMSELAAKALMHDDVVLEPNGSVAWRLEKIERRVCAHVAEYAFKLAGATGAKVFGGPKWTVSPVYEGMLKEEMDAAAARHPETGYDPQLIDATFFLLFQAAVHEPLVIPALNRDGDILSDLVLPLFGSIAGAESSIIALDDHDLHRKAILAEAPHGTAPALEGRNVANPLAMILAVATLLESMRRSQGARIRAAALAAVADGVRTGDLGGSASTSEFVDQVIARLGGDA